LPFPISQLLLLHSSQEVFETTFKCNRGQHLNVMNVYRGSR
jgi:hypothetical protein